MQMKILIFAMITLGVNLYNVGNECQSKAIFNGNTLLEPYADVKKAFNGAASCVSLRSDDESLCCYIKAKFKNRIADQKFTHKGCIELTGEDLADVKATTKRYEAYLENDSETYKDVDVDIDCNSKFIKLTGLVILALLL